MHRPRYTQAHEALSLLERVGCIWSAHKVDFHEASEDLRSADCYSEWTTVGDRCWRSRNSRPQCTLGCAKVRRGEAFKPQLRGEVRSECVELVGVASREEYPAILKMQKDKGHKRIELSHG